jgi:hypothetical protein
MMTSRTSSIIQRRQTVLCKLEAVSQAGFFVRSASRKLSGDEAPKKEGCSVPPGTFHLSPILTVDRIRVVELGLVVAQCAISFGDVLELWSVSSILVDYSSHVPILTHIVSIRDKVALISTESGSSA